MGEREINFAYETKKKFMIDYFKDLDSKNTGKLNRSDIRKALEIIDEKQIAEEKIDKILDRDDKNGDGMLDFSESRILVYKYALKIDSLKRF